jgi:ABC-2 type transport system ATP-binding protein
MIHTHELTKRYARNEALHALTIKVPAGSVFALVGPNGAGKTTAIKTIMNLVFPTSGRADVLGTDSRSAFGTLPRGGSYPGTQREDGLAAFDRR